MRHVVRDTAALQVLSCIAATALLALPVSASAKWKSPAARDEYAQRADALYARFIPGAVAAARTGRSDPAADAPSAERSSDLPLTATSSAPGHAGYVHYFVIRPPNGPAEMQVGIELADERIAWSVPGLGVAVSPFVDSGTLDVHGTPYEVQHLFGLRPFRSDEAMAGLAAGMTARIAPWIDAGVGYCDPDPATGGCVSCLGFVLRVLYPGYFPGYPALPRDFVEARAGERYTTDDLLLYLTGLHRYATREARRGRVQALDVPQNLREELMRVVSAEDTPSEPAVRPAARSRPGARANSKKGVSRAQPSRRRL